MLCCVKYHPIARPGKLNNLIIVLRSRVYIFGQCTHFSSAVQSPFIIIIIMLLLFVDPTRLCTAVLLLSLMTSSNPTLVDAGVVGSTSSRWVYPCAGGVVVEGLGDDVSGLVLGSEGGMTDLMARVDWSNTLHSLTDRTVRLKRRVRALKDLYVSVRGRNVTQRSTKYMLPSTSM